MWSYEKKAASSGFLMIAGVDEAGRGPLAGPVVSAAVVLPSDFPIDGITDSKKLSPKKRDLLFDVIMDGATAVGIGMADAEEIDRENILQASLLSMARAVQGLSVAPDYLLIDGIFKIPYDTGQLPIKKGDSKSISIASASIIAKVTRDRMMLEYHQKYPEYGFNGHKGYPTKAHRQAIAKFGPCPIHRRTFKGVIEYL